MTRSRTEFRPFLSFVVLWIFLFNSNYSGSELLRREGRGTNAKHSLGYGVRRAYIEKAHL